MANTAGLIKILKGQVGYRETGTNHQKYSPAVPGLEWSQNQSWCATFASWAYLKAGLRPNKDFPVTASCLAAVSWYKSHKRWTSTPHVGDQVLYGPGGGEHTEIVIGVSSTSITTIGGNTSGSLGGTYFNGDGVYQKSVARSASRIYGYGRPNFGAVKATSGGDDDVPYGISLQCTSQAVKKGVPCWVWWNKENADSQKQHSGSDPGILTSAGSASVQVNVHGCDGQFQLVAKNMKTKGERQFGNGVHARNTIDVGIGDLYKDEHLYVKFVPAEDGKIAAWAKGLWWK